MGKKKKLTIRILIGKEEEDLLAKMDKKKLKELNKSFKRMKPVLDRLGKKETTDQDVWNFIRLIENNIIEKLLEKIDDMLCSRGMHKEHYINFLRGIKDELSRMRER